MTSVAHGTQKLNNYNKPRNPHQADKTPERVI